MGRPQRDGWLRTITSQLLDLFLHLLHRHKIDNIFRCYISSFRPLQQVQLDTLRKIFISQEGIVGGAIVVFGEALVIEICVDPGSYLPGIECSLPLSF